MYNCLWARYIAPKMMPSCNHVIAQMEKLKYQEDKGYSMANKPKYLSQVLEGNSWQDMERLTTSKALDWTKTLQDDILGHARQLKKLDNDKVTKIFGSHTGIEYRALCRVQGGHYNILTLQYAEATLCEEGKQIRLFRIKCILSLKLDMNSVFLAFDHDTGEYILTLASWCLCPAGYLFCSHMLVFILMLYLVQIHQNRDAKILEGALPALVKLLQKLPVLFAMVYGKYRK